MPDAVDLRPMPGPIPSLMPAGYEVADVGYVEEEYLVSGKANVYDWPQTGPATVRTPDGQTVQKPLVVTLERCIMKDAAGKEQTGRWIVTTIKGSQPQKTT